MIWRKGADQRRDQLLQGIPTKPGYDRDEAPAAVLRKKVQADVATCPRARIVPPAPRSAGRYRATATVFTSAIGLRHRCQIRGRGWSGPPCLYERVCCIRRVQADDGATRRFLASVRMDPWGDRLRT